MLPFYVTKKLGYIIQALVIYIIHIAVFYELYPIYELLDELGEYENSFNYIIGWPIYFLVMFYFILSSGLSPGSLRKNWHIYKEEDKETLNLCQKCNVFRPFRTFHCTRCGTCMVRRDHHCDFINRCVGFNNIKPFLGFTISVVVGCSHFFFRALQWTIYWWKGELESVKAYSGLYAGGLVFHMIVHLLFIFLIARLAIRCWFNLAVNLTLIDEYNMFTRPWLWNEYIDPINLFHFGIVKNVTDVLGRNPLYWLFPAPPRKFGLMQGPQFDRSIKIPYKDFPNKKNLEVLPFNILYKMYLASVEVKKLNQKYQTLIDKFKT